MDGFLYLRLRRRGFYHKNALIGSGERRRFFRDPRFFDEKVVALLDLVMLFDRFNRALIDEEVLVVHDVVNIERTGLDDLRLLEVARGTEKIFVAVVGDHKHIKALIALLRGQRLFERQRNVLRLRRIHDKRIEHLHLAILYLLGKHGKESNPLHFFVHLLRVILVVARTMRFSAAHPDRRSGGAVTGAASAFLPPRLLAAATHFAAILHVRQWLAGIRNLRLEHLPNERAGST